MTDFLSDPITYGDAFFILFMVVFWHFVFTFARAWYERRKVNKAVQKAFPTNNDIAEYTLTVGDYVEKWKWTDGQWKREH